MTIYMVRALALTIVFEVGAAFLLGVSIRRDCIVVVLAQVVTNPLLVLLVFLLNLRFGVQGRIVGLIMLEPLAVLAEALLYRGTLEYKKLNPFVFSLILNGVSFFLGEILNRFL